METKNKKEEEENDTKSLTFTGNLRDRRKRSK